MMKGGFVVFKGPLKDNKGNRSIAAGSDRGETDVELEKMNYWSKASSARPPDASSGRRRWCSVAHRATDASMGCHDGASDAIRRGGRPCELRLRQAARARHSLIPARWRSRCSAVLLFALFLLRCSASRRSSSIALM